MKRITFAAIALRLSQALVPALLVLPMLASPVPSFAQVSVGISIGIAPPASTVTLRPTVLRPCRQS